MSDTRKIHGYKIPSVVKAKVEETEEIFPMKIGVKVESEGKCHTSKIPVEVIKKGNKFTCKDGKSSYKTLQEAVAAQAAEIATGLVK